jgi:hypothetical protein
VNRALTLMKFYNSGLVAAASLLGKAKARHFSTGDDRWSVPVLIERLGSRAACQPAAKIAHDRLVSVLEIVTGIETKRVLPRSNQAVPC